MAFHGSMVPHSCPDTLTDLPPIWGSGQQARDPYTLRGEHPKGWKGQQAALKSWRAVVDNARTTVRQQHPVERWMEWAVTSMEGASLWPQLAHQFDGVVFVGDSQIREAAWGAMQWVSNSTGRSLRLRPGDSMFQRYSDRSRATVPRSPCVPMEVGKLGFTGVCSAVRPALTAREAEPLPTGKYKGRDAGSYSGTEFPCHLSSNVGPNVSTADLYARMLRSHEWDGVLALSERACEGFFVSYQAAWGATRLQPDVLPACFRKRRVLWVVNGAPAHELQGCAANKWELPQTVLAGFSERALRERVVWQPAAGAYFDDNNCTETTADVAASEVWWLKRAGVRYYDNTKLAARHAPLMQDAKHWTYYWAPCHGTFPEMTLVSALLAVRAALLPPGACVA